MKSFFCSLGLFLLMIGLIAWNFCYINASAKDLLDAVRALPDTPDEAALEQIEDLHGFWQARIGYIGLSVGYTVVDRISEQIVALQAAAECANAYDYHTARLLLSDAVGDMRRLEQFSISNIF